MPPTLPSLLAVATLCLSLLALPTAAQQTKSPPVAPPAQPAQPLPAQQQPVQPAPPRPTQAQPAAPAPLRPAAPSEPLVVAVVDVQAVMRDARAAQGLKSQVDQTREAFEKDVERKKLELKGAEDELRRQQGVLSAEAMEQRRRQLERRFADARRQAEDRQAVVNRGVNEAMGKLREAMAVSVADVMKNHGVTMVLPRSAVLVFDENLNLTREVIEVLNRRLPDLRANLGDGAAAPSPSAPAAAGKAPAGKAPASK